MKNATERFHQRLIETLENLPGAEKEKFCRKKAWPRKVVIAACAVLVLSGTVLAASSVIQYRTGSSAAADKYTSFPSYEMVEKDIGYPIPKVPEQFKNGYGFEGGVPVKWKDYDKNNRIVARLWGVMYRYQKDADTVSLYIEKAEENPGGESETAPQEDYDGIGIYYSAYENKCVPGDYRLTEQDKMDQESGKYIFSYGAEQIEVSSVQSVWFYQDGCKVSLLGRNSLLSREEFLEMAKEIIDMNR